MKSVLIQVSSKAPFIALEDWVIGFLDMRFKSSKVGAIARSCEKEKEKN